MSVRVIGSEVRAAFSSFAHRWNLTNSVLGMGTHHWWRRILMRLAPQMKSGFALDVVPGRGT